MSDHAATLAAALRALLRDNDARARLNARIALAAYDAERARMWPAHLNLPATNTGD